MRNMTAHGSLHLGGCKAEQVPQGLRDLGSSKRIFSLLFFENYQKNIDFLQEKIYYDDIKKDIKLILFPKEGTDKRKYRRAWYLRKAGRKEIMAEIKFTEEKKLKAAPGFPMAVQAPLVTLAGIPMYVLELLVWGR